MDDNDDRRDEAVDMEEGRATGPRWAELNEEASRNHRADLFALWCRRLAGLMVWTFVGFIFGQLWQEAWQTKDLKLMGVCLLVTLSLMYALVKRYQHIRETGLTGVELVRALATDALSVDNNGGVRLRGVTPKARAMCVDFKYDPEVTFRERSAGCGFELYPPPSAQPSDLSSPSSSSTTPMSMSAMAAGEGERKEEEEEGGRGAGTITGWRKGRRRRRGKWQWAWRGGTGSGTSTGQGNDDGGTPYAEAKADEEVPITQDGGRGGSGGGGGGGGGRDLRQTTGEAIGQPRSASTPPSPPDFATGGPRGGEGGGEGRQRQVIRASELSASCSVCLYDYFLDEAVTLLPCAHLYHTECIDIWMRDHVDCPYCRADMNVWCNTGGAAAVSRTGIGAPAAAAAASGGYPTQETAGTATLSALDARAAASDPPNLGYPTSSLPLPFSSPGNVGVGGGGAAAGGEGGAVPAPGQRSPASAPAAAVAAAGGLPS